MCVSERCISPQCVLHPHYRQLLQRASPCCSQGVGMHNSHSTMDTWTCVRVVLGWAPTPAANPSRACVYRQGSLWDVWEGCAPIPRGPGSCSGGSSWTQASLFNVWPAPCQTVSCKATWCGSGLEPQAGLGQPALSWWYCATTSDLFPLHAVAWFILP